LNSTLDLTALVRSRRSIRHFADREVPRGLIWQLVADCQWAPSPHNSQPWRFILLTMESKVRLARAMGQSLRADLVAQNLAALAIEDQVGRSVSRISSAPAGLLCSIVTEGLRMVGDQQLDGLEMQMAVQSVGAVLQTMFLLATDRGLGACWMAAPMYCPEVVRRLLALDESHRPQGLVLLGYPKHPGRVRPRRPIEEILEAR